MKDTLYIILHFSQASHYLIVQLPGHTCPEEALNSNSCRALLLVSSPGRPHANSLLNDNSCSGSSQERNITDKEIQSAHFRSLLVENIPVLLLVYQLHSPACLVTPDISLYGDSRFLHLQVFLAGQPAADGLLDADAGRAQFI